MPTFAPDGVTYTLDVVWTAESLPARNVRETLPAYVPVVSAVLVSAHCGLSVAALTSPRAVRSASDAPIMYPPMPSAAKTITGSVGGAVGVGVRLGDGLALAVLVTGFDAVGDWLSGGGEPWHAVRTNNAPTIAAVSSRLIRRAGGRAARRCGPSAAGARAPGRS